MRSYWKHSRTYTHTHKCIETQGAQSRSERAPIGTMFSILSHETNYCIVNGEQTDGPATDALDENKSHRCLYFSFFFFFVARCLPFAMFTFYSNVLISHFTSTFSDGAHGTTTLLCRFTAKMKQTTHPKRTKKLCIFNRKWRKIKTQKEMKERDTAQTKSHLQWTRGEQSRTPAAPAAVTNEEWEKRRKSRSKKASTQPLIRFTNRPRVYEPMNFFPPVDLYKLDFYQ